MLAKDEAQSDEIQWIQPSNDNEGDSDNNEPAPISRPITRQSSFDMSIKMGATRIMNPKNKKHMETCLVENDTSDSLQTILANETCDVDEQIWIQPGTTAEDYDGCEKAHNSILQEFKETISETLHHLHLPHHSKSDGMIKDKHGLLETAMETMLIEQANIMGAPSVAASDHVESVKFEERRNSSIESLRKLLVSPFRRRSNESNDIKAVKREPKKEKFSLFDSAMKTMLNETAHIIEGVGVHPKSIDEDDVTLVPEEVLRDGKSNKFSDGNGAFVGKMTPSQSYSNFCDNLTSSQVLANAEAPNSGERSQSICETPIFVLTKCTSKHNIKGADANSGSQNLSPNRVHSVKSKPATKPNLLNVNQENNPNKPLTHSHSSDLINLTNNTKLLAPDPYSKHRSHNDHTVPAQSANKHTRTESYGLKTHSSPTKVPTSSSSYNTTSAAATNNLSSSKGKDGKENKDTICRRSSDSDLSVTPKGKHITTYF